jgi:hypothetical protein
LISRTYTRETLGWVLVAASGSITSSIPAHIGSGIHRVSGLQVKLLSLFLAGPTESALKSCRSRLIYEGNQITITLRISGGSYTPEDGNQSRP